MPQPKSSRTPRNVTLMTRALCAGTLLVSCAVPGQPGGPKAGGETKTSVGTLAAPGTLSTPLPTPGGPPVAGGPTPGAPPTGGPALPAIATLTGVVRVPATILSNNGGNVVAGSDGSMSSGGSLITDNGAGLITRTKYALRATVDEIPLAGATVRLQDAKGQDVAATTTDQAGRYRFDGDLPRQNLLLRVDLPGDAGAVRAVVARKAAEVPVVDVDLVSTLTTTYVLDRYVQTQAIDPQATLDKLPADVEAETRTKAGAALAASGPLALEALTPVALVNTVEALRKVDDGLDAQLERVKRLLIVAGLSDLGNGLPGTEVDLAGATTLAPGPDGTLYVGGGRNGRVWHLGKDGRVRAMVGSGSGHVDPIVQGKRALDAQLASPHRLAVDAAGRLITAELWTHDLAWHFRVTRREPDGTLTELLPFDVTAPNYTLQGVAAGAGDEVLAFFQDGNVYALAAGQPAKLVRTLGTHFGSVGLDAAGNLYYVNPTEDPTRLEKGTNARSAVTYQFSGRGSDRQFDARGNLFAFDADGRLILVEPGAEPKTLLPNHRVALPPGPGATRSYYQATLATDGTAYVSNGGRVYHVVGGAATHVVGRDAPVAGAATSTALNGPDGAALAPDGALVVSERGARRLIRIQGGETSVLAKVTGSGVRADGVGYLYTLGAGINRITPGGEVSRFHTAEEVGDAIDYVVAADGTVYCGLNSGVGVVRVANDGTRSVAVPAGPTGQAYRVALGPGGALYVGDSVGRIRRWTEAEGVTTLKEDRALAIYPHFYGYGYLAVDARGRVYTCGDASITRLDPVTGAVEPVAGPGTARFAGTGVDDSIDTPCGLTFAPNGDLYFVDQGHQQVKRIPAADL